MGACSVQNPGEDDYWFEDASGKADRSIKIVLHPNREDMVRSFPEKIAPDGLAGYAKVTSKTCEVHVVDPAKSYDPSFLGHEITHCLYGEWHPSQQTK